jgi:hypothetical protein
MVALPPCLLTLPSQCRYFSGSGPLPGCRAAPPDQRNTRRHGEGGSGQGGDRRPQRPVVRHAVSRYCWPRDVRPGGRPGEATAEKANPLACLRRQARACTLHSTSPHAFPSAWSGVRHPTGSPPSWLARGRALRRSSSIVWQCLAPHDQRRVREIIENAGRRCRSGGGESRSNGGAAVPPHRSDHGPSAKGATQNARARESPSPLTRVR